MSPLLEQYWSQFLGSLPDSPERPREYYESFCFGSSRESALMIAALVLNGVKTATGSLQWVYEHEGRLPPAVGQYSIVTDREQQPLCIIQDTEVRVVPFDEVDAAFARDGGEEDRTLDSWRHIYWDYIVSECARVGRQPTQKTPLVCEHFRLVYKKPLMAE